MPRRSASSSTPRMGQGLTSCSSASWETPLHKTQVKNVLPATSLGLLLPNIAPKHILTSPVRAARNHCTRITNLQVHPQGLVAQPSIALLMSWVHQAASAPKHRMHIGKQLHQSVPTKLSPGPEEQQTWENF